MKEKLLIHTVNEAYSFQPDQVICIEADGNYCNLHLSNGNEYLLSFQLGQVESIIKEQLSYTNHSFVRVGKSLIVNMDELICVNITKQTLEMNQPSGEKLLFNASREALKKLMNLLIENNLRFIKKPAYEVWSAQAELNRALRITLDDLT